MSQRGPFLLIDDDEDDRFLISQAIKNLAVPNPVHNFADALAALDYLKQEKDQPFLILCDINMPLMNGLELRAYINKHQQLRKKSIPFVFLTTTASEEAIQIAYNESVQGFYQKAYSLPELQRQLGLIISYWQECLHPNSNSFDKVPNSRNLPG